MKKLIALLTACMLALSAAACGSTQTPAADSENSSSSVETVVAESTPESEAISESSIEEDSLETVYPVTVTDQLGREVTIEAEPETLVSGYYISTSLLIALNQQDKLVGVEAKADSRSIYRLAAPSLIDLPSVGTAKEFDFEGCAALSPDLVIVPARLKDSISVLEELGLTVLAVNPENQDLLEEAVTLLGVATNSQAQAESLLSYTDTKLAELTDSLNGVEAPIVYLAGNSSLLSTAGPAMYQSTMIENAGGINAANEITDTYWAEISYEQLLAWNPDYIILAADADYTVESVLEDANLAECNAVVNGNVYKLPGNIEAWDSPLPGSVLGSLWMASVLHPEEYTAGQWQDSVKEFYETYYRFTPDDALFSAEE